MSAGSRAKNALRLRYQSRSRADVDAKGYVRIPEANLVDGVRLDAFEADLRAGGGNELRQKFCAVHSSAALAVNSFALFKNHPEHLRLFGLTPPRSITFEKPLRIFPGRRPASIDVWIDHGRCAVAVESKLLEYFQRKKPVFASAYDALAPPRSDPGWWTVFQDAKVAGRRNVRQHLDRAQLLKHYFGMRRWLESSSGRQRLTLLYLFWEPLNWQDVAECVAHRHEVAVFANQVAPGSSIDFKWNTYAALWEEWASEPTVESHVRNLRARYEMRL